MEDIIVSVFNIALYPFTSRTFFVWLPCMFCFIGFCFAFIRRLMRGRF